MTDQMTMVGRGKALTPTDYKTLEGQRIQALMAAVAALPGAALVASGSEGAPFFAAALMTVAAAFAFWIFTDALYNYSIVQPREEGEAKRMERSAYHFFWSNVGYMVASIALTMAGFAGVHSDIRLNISVAGGFGLTALLAVAVTLHVLWSAHERNHLGKLTRAASIANKAPA